MASQRTISHHKQATRPVTYGTRTQRSQETVGLVPASVAVARDLSAVPEKMPHTHTQRDIQTSSRLTGKQRLVLSNVQHILAVTPSSSLHNATLQPSCVIKSISCASAVPRQITFKQVQLFSGEQMGVCLESLIWSRQC